ncbi:hypothetical protein [uncultured Alteromonas sp.]|jgi:hypothetical protein|uniref:hypothetical protein n=1 Tax=uncultured Alteromonas sp. TaxID=179113 RepID=UPI00258752CE|nr:hypothetical protein [uncultured Alteromonas sp.]|tara:strand:+ start:188 stop:388 length:201 start_codon:yes stop_codon:yes gene_type:complete
MISKNEQKQLVLGRVEKWAGGLNKAFTWYETEKIPALECTPSEAIEAGHFEALMNYLDAIELGGYA